MKRYSWYKAGAAQQVRGFLRNRRTSIGAAIFIKSGAPAPDSGLLGNAAGHISNATGLSGGGTTGAMAGGMGGIPLGVLLAYLLRNKDDEDDKGSGIGSLLSGGALGGLAGAGLGGYLGNSAGQAGTQDFLSNLGLSGLFGKGKPPAQVGVSGQGPAVDYASEGPADDAGYQAPKSTSPSGTSGREADIAGEMGFVPSSPSGPTPGSPSHQRWMKNRATEEYLQKNLPGWTPGGPTPTQASEGDDPYDVNMALGANQNVINGIPGYSPSGPLPYSDAHLGWLNATGKGPITYSSGEDKGKPIDYNFDPTYTEQRRHLGSILNARNKAIAD